MSLAEQADSRPRIGRYAVIGRIGRGGMGMVYRGLDETLEREVAVKTLTVEGTLDEESRKRFEIEAKAAARLQHTNIVTVFELGEDRGVPFIAMELLPGVDLEALVRSKEAMPLEEELDIVIQVLRGLAFAHEHGVVHRDIKPSNIRLLDDGTAKIMDFGIAKLGGTNVTRTGMMVGTVYYMSPEQIRGKRLDGRSDVFSVGVILHEMLSGRRPFTGKGSPEVLFKIVNEAPPALPEHLGAAGPRLGEIVARALAKDREQRYASATEMANELSEVLTEFGSASSSEAVETVNRCRTLVKSGKLEEAAGQLRDLVAQTPGSLEALRTLRMVSRELKRRDKPKEPDSGEYPELAATFQTSPTRREPATIQQSAPQPTVEQPAPAAAASRPGGGRWLLGLAGVGLAAAAAVGLLLLGGGGTGQPGAQAVVVPVHSVPRGAEVFMDGRPTGILTDGELNLPAGVSGEKVLSFRKAGYVEQSRTVRLPLNPGQTVTVNLPPAAFVVSVVTEPPGAAVSLDASRVEGTTPLELSVDPAREHVLQLELEGHDTRQVRLVPGEITDKVEVSLEKTLPPGKLRVASPFAVDVIWRDETLARGQTAPTLTLPAGEQEVRLVSRAYLLDRRVRVDIREGGESSYQLAAPGKISIKAIPSNCRILIGGRFVDYPPILEKPIASGQHRVSFHWSDGTRKDEVVTVKPGDIGYATGRKD